MENKILIKNKIPAVITYPEKEEKHPVIILCHGTASNKDEVGGLFIKLSKKLKEKNIASIRFDFAGCGDSNLKEEDLTFLNEVEDTRDILEFLKNNSKINKDKIGILGFSQGARVMASFLEKNNKDIKCAVSWSGTCHNGIGAYNILFKEYYKKAKEKGVVMIPMTWREDIAVSLKWFDDIKNTNPLNSLSFYKGPIFAISGKLDNLVDPSHALEIAKATSGKIQDYKIYDNLNHMFNILNNDDYIAVIDDTVSWIEKHIL